jgi:hypothetical protein
MGTNPGKVDNMDRLHSTLLLVYKSRYSRRASTRFRDDFVGGTAYICGVADDPRDF